MRARSNLPGGVPSLEEAQDIIATDPLRYYRDRVEVSRALNQGVISRFQQRVANVAFSEVDIGSPGGTGACRLPGHLSSEQEQRDDHLQIRPAHLHAACGPITV
jgi:hypothetical protein